MLRPTLLVSAVVLTALLGCATPYQRQGFTGGYSERPLNDRSYVVAFDGNGYTSRSRVQEYLLRRCAELTIAQGYSYFIVLDENASAQRYRSKLGSDTATVRPDGLGGATVTVTEAPTLDVTKHSAKVRIYLLDEAELSGGIAMQALDADMILEPYSAK